MDCLICFSDCQYSSLSLPANTPLAEALTIQNSPVLFGCRTGICGTCLVEVEGDIPPPSEEEKEVLEVVAPNSPKARLACQIQLTGSINLRVSGEL